MSTRPYKRRHFFVKKNFQGRFILIFLSIAAVGGILSLVAFNFLSVKKIELLLYSIHIPAKRLNEILFKEMIYSNMFSFLFVLLGFLVTVRWLSGKVSGPLYRVKKDLESIRDGDLSFAITLRYKDEFKDFASELNLFVEKFRRVFGALQRQTDVIDGYVRDIERNHHRADIVKLRAHQVVVQIEEMNEVLSQFKTN